MPWKVEKRDGSEKPWKIIRIDTGEVVGASTSEEMAKRAVAARYAHEFGGKKMAKGGIAKVGKVMHEFKEGMLHSGSKKGPEVTNRKQAVAIALSEARKAGAKIPKK